MHNNDALLAVYRAGTKMEIDAIKAAGRPETFDFLPGMRKQINSFS